MMKRFTRRIQNGGNLWNTINTLIKKEIDESKSTWAIMADIHHTSTFIWYRSQLKQYFDIINAKKKSSNFSDHIIDDDLINAYQNIIIILHEIIKSSPEKYKSFFKKIVLAISQSNEIQSYQQLFTQLSNPKVRQSLINLIESIKKIGPMLESDARNILNAICDILQHTLSSSSWNKIKPISQEYEFVDLRDIDAWKTVKSKSRSRSTRATWRNRQGTKTRKQRK